MELWIYHGNIMIFLGYHVSPVVYKHVNQSVFILLITVIQTILFSTVFHCKHALDGRLYLNVSRRTRS